MILEVKLSPFRSLTLIVAVLLGAGGAEAQTPQDVVLYASKATVKAGAWKTVADASAGGGSLLVHPDAGAAKIATPLADPMHYFELSFYAVAKTPYRLWLRGKAEKNHYNNDSVYVQFSDSVTAAGAAVNRIGTASAAYVILEEDRGRGVAGWGWQDNAWGTNVEPSPIYFASTGRKTIRIQTREDGFAIDQILLSPLNYRTSSPGALKYDTVILPENTGLSSALTLKVVSWNIRYGEGTDEVTNLDRTATTILNQQPDIALLCEVINDQAKQLETLLERKTGVAWHSYRFGSTSTNGLGSAVLSKHPFVSTSGLNLSYRRYVAQAIVNVGGRNISVFSAHLDNDSSTERRTQAKELLSFASNFAEPRIMGGDFNASYSSEEIGYVTDLYYDAWRQAVETKTARAYSDNSVSLATRTRRSRIDYIFYSRGARNVTLTAAQVPDLRDLTKTNVRVKLGTADDKGVRPSDHNLVSATLEFK